MGINSTEVSYSFGQLGSGFVADTGAFTPPTGKVIVGIQFVTDSVFSLLTADTDNTDDVSFAGTATQIAQNGTNSDAVTGSITFPAGMTIVGRWTAATLASGSVIYYFGQ